MWLPSRWFARRDNRLPNPCNRNAKEIFWLERGNMKSLASDEAPWAVVAATALVGNLIKRVAIHVRILAVKQGSINRGDRC